MRANPWLKMVISLVVLLGLLGVLVFTPLGGWLWRGFLNLPGIAWAREQMEAVGFSQDDGGAGFDDDIDTGRINEILRAGHAAQQRGADDEALRRYREALKLSDRYAPTHMALAGIYMKLGQDDKALEELEKAAKLAPDDAFVLTQLGRMYLNKDRHDEAVIVLERAKRADPQDSDVRYLLGASYYYRSFDDAHNAVVELEKAAQSAPDEAEVQFYLGMAYARRDDDGDAQLAIRALRKAVQLNPDYGEAYYYLGQLYLGQRQLEPAMEAWKRYVAVGRDEQKLARVRAWLRNLQEGGR